MRWVCLMVLIIILPRIWSFLITGLILIWVVLFVPQWFYELVQDIYTANGFNTPYGMRMKRLQQVDIVIVSGGQALRFHTNYDWRS